MRVTEIARWAAVILGSATTSNALNIILNNDDGFGSANIREFYGLLRESGHNAWIVAPATNQSGQGGRAVFTTERYLTTESEFGLVPKGAPSFGTDPSDSHIWYYNGTPAACTFFALDYVVPRYWNGTQPDLLVAGPNFGLNAGPFLYTLSGTMGATYAAAGRGIPAISFSASNDTQRSYKEVDRSVTAEGLPTDPATLNARLAVKLVNELARSAAQPGPAKQPLLPSGYGLNVNFPEISSAPGSSCVDPPFYLTRLSGGADTDRAAYNETTGLFHYADLVPPEGTGINACINGDCWLPGETELVSKCATPVSIFTVDYDAPATLKTASVAHAMSGLVKKYDGRRRLKRDAGFLQSRYRNQH